MPRQSTCETNVPDRYRLMHTMNFPDVGDIVIYNEKCRFLNADRKPRARITTVYTSLNPHFPIPSSLSRKPILDVDVSESSPS
jgi:hypothetical protein